MCPAAITEGMLYASKPSVLVLQVFVVFIFTFGAQYFHEFVEDLFKKFIGTLVSRW